MNITANLLNAVDVDETIKGALTITDAATSGSVRLDVRVTYTSTGAVYTSTPVAYNGATTNSVFTFTNGTSMNWNQQTGIIVYNRLVTDYTDGTTDTYSFDFILSSSSDSVSATESITTRKNLAITEFSADAANDISNTISGDIAIIVLKDEGVTIKASVAGTSFEVGNEQSFSNDEDTYTWEFSNGSEFSIDKAAGTWLYKRPTADIGDLKPSIYTFSVEIKDSYQTENGYASLTTSVTYPPVINSFAANVASDTDAHITGDLSISNADESNIAISVSKNGYIYTGESQDYATEITWAFADHSSFVLNTVTNKWVYTRSSDNVGANTSDVYVFNVACTNSVGSDLANCTIATTVPKAEISGFSTGNIIDSEANIVGVLDIAMPTPADNPTLKVDVTRNGTIYTADAVSLSDKQITFTYSDGTKFVYAPASSSFTYQRNNDDLQATTSDTYVFDVTIVVNGQTTIGSLVAKTLIGRRVYSYAPAYPIHFAAGGTETAESAWPKVILEYERIYRLLNDNMNYYEGMFQELVQRMSGLEKFVENFGANKHKVIVMFSGTLAEIPDGWQLCDGTNGTPDLRDKFIMGSAGDSSTGETGGANSVTLTAKNIPDHYHKFGDDNYDNNGHFWGVNYKIRAKHPLQPAGTISVFNWNGASHFNGYRVVSETENPTTYVTSLPLTEKMVGGTTSSSFEILPPYYRLAFIMKLKNEDI